jgi:hypothetical protein
MTFTLDPTTSRGRVRLLIGDTDTEKAANQIFSDGEIDAFLDLESQDVYAAAAAACRALAASSTRSAIAWRSMKSSMDQKDIPKRYAELGDTYAKKSTAGSPWEEMDSLDYRIGPYGGDGSEFVGDTC